MKQKTVMMRVTPENKARLKSKGVYGDTYNFLLGKLLDKEEGETKC